MLWLRHPCHAAAPCLLDVVQTIRCLQEFMERESVLAEDGTREVPSLDKFEAEIAKFHAVEADVQAMPSFITEGLFHINTQPLKQALVVLVSKWIYLYTQSLQQRVGLRTHTLSRLHDFQSSQYDEYCRSCHSPAMRLETAAMQVLESTGELLAFMATANAALDTDVEADSADSEIDLPKVQGSLSQFPCFASSTL